jgi:hypothetical protein
MLKKLLLLIVLIIITTNIHSQTYIREYTYHASESDSKLDARHKSINEIKRLLIEELGAYINTVTTYSSEQNKISINTYTKVISESITKIKILYEKWDGKTYYVKTSITIDKKDMIRRLNEIKRDYESKGMDTDITTSKVNEYTDTKYNINRFFFQAGFSYYTKSNLSDFNFTGGYFFDNNFYVGGYISSNFDIHSSEIDYLSTILFGGNVGLFYNKKKFFIDSKIRIGMLFVDYTYMDSDDNISSFSIEPQINVGKVFQLNYDDNETMEKISMSIGLGYRYIGSKEKYKEYNNVYINFSLRMYINFMKK